MSYNRSMTLRECEEAFSGFVESRRARASFWTDGNAWVRWTRIAKRLGLIEYHTLKACKRTWCKDLGGNAFPKEHDPTLRHCRLTTTAAVAFTLTKKWPPFGDIMASAHNAL
jgi:hypothetical protein